MQTAFHASKEEVGRVASVGTLFYAAGKLVSGPIVDRLGGRQGFLLAMLAVAVWGAAGGLAPGLFGLTFFYGLNRLAGSAAWGAAVKLVPTWFGVRRTATVLGVLSLSYVLGGVLATLLARQILTAGGGWRAIMGLPSVVLLLLALACAALVKAGPLHGDQEGLGRSVPTRAEMLLSLLRRPQFLVACGLSFTVTLMRESFNTWTVDFLTSIQPGAKSVAAAALHSVTFDLAGAGAIFVTGLAYDRIGPSRRRWLMVGTLAFLAAILAVLPGAAAASPVYGAWLVGVVGLLVYGPYSLLSGVLAIESGGADQAATAAGLTWISHTPCGRRRLSRREKRAEVRNFRLVMVVVANDQECKPRPRRASIRCDGTRSAASAATGTFTLDRRFGVLTRRASASRAVTQA